MNEFWQNKIEAFLHDPPDKALILGTPESHEKIAARLWYLVGLKDDADRFEKNGLKHTDQEIHRADCEASTMQRINLPQDLREFEVYYTRESSNALIKHTLSGFEYRQLRSLIASYGYKNLRMMKNHKVIELLPKLQKLNSEWKKKYFLLWRFLPDLYHLGYIMPADTRIPDHSIWDHLDVTSAIYSCLEGGLSLFAVKLPAVQEFISHSRKLSDLWASSHIFSLLLFEGIKVILDKLGPDVIIYPQLRGNPMLDLAEFCDENKKHKFTLFDEGKKLEILDDEIKEKLHVANFPNTFLAFVPYSEAEEFAKKVENAIKQKWREIAEKTKKLLDDAGIKVYEQLWNSQIENTIEVTSTWLEFFNFGKFNNVKKEIPKDLKDKQEKWLSFVEEVEKKSNYGHFYSLTYEILSAILTQKSRFWNKWEEEPKPKSKKCLMCGRRSALVENHLEKGYQSWNGKEWRKVDVSDTLKYLLKEDERLCAVCLIKRLYGSREGIFKELFGIKPPKQESVVHIAARDFIENVKDHPILSKIIKKDIELIYEHEWGESEDKIAEEKRNVIEELKKDTNKNGEELKKEVKKAYEQIRKKPSKYYAILMMDGDRIGKMLSGENLPDLGEFLHPAFKKKIQGGKGKGNELITIQRLLTPSHHIAISRAMKDFSLYKVREIVKKYEGFLVYAGGDDVLALFPTDKVLDAVYEIQKAFKEDFYEVKGKKAMGLGNKASMSAGIVFAHYKWPLYDAIERVRTAEKNAKEEYGRNAFCITFIKRSGEILTAGGKWEFKEYFDEILNLLSPKDEEKRRLSHRFIYDFIKAIRVLRKNDKERGWKEPYVGMLKAEVKWLLKRKNYKSRLTKDDIEDLQREVFSPLIDKYVKKELPLESMGELLKILYDAYRGEER